MANHSRPPLGDLLALCAHPECRELCRYLSESDQASFIVDTLVEQIEPVADVGRDELHIQLVHGHLPRLDDAGIVSVDQDAMVVHYEGGERVETVVETVNALAEELET